MKFNKILFLFLLIALIAVPAFAQDRSSGGIKGKVRRIGVYNHHEPLRLQGSIEDRRQVERLVRLVLRAPFREQDPASGPDDEPYVVSFHLADGTATSRLFNAKTGFLAGGVIVPDTFTAAVRQAVARDGGAAAP